MREMSRQTIRTTAVEEVPPPRLAWQHDPTLPQTCHTSLVSTGPRFSTGHRIPAGYIELRVRDYGFRVWGMGFTYHHAARVEGRRRKWRGGVPEERVGAVGAETSESVTRGCGRMCSPRALPPLLLLLCLKSGSDQVEHAAALFPPGVLSPQRCMEHVLSPDPSDV